MAKQELWIQEVIHFLADKDEVSINQILIEGLGYYRFQISRADQMAVAELIKNLGWQKIGRKKFNGVRTRLYGNPLETNQLPKIRIPYTPYFLDRYEVKSCEIKTELMVKEKDAKLIESINEICSSLESVILELEGIKALLGGEQ